MTINITIDDTTNSKELYAIKALVESLLTAAPVRTKQEIRELDERLERSLANFTKQELRELDEEIIQAPDGFTNDKVVSIAESVPAPAEIFKQNKYEIVSQEDVIPETLEVTGKTEYVTINATAPYTRDQLISTTGVETDAAGLPWDHRIHSRTRSKTVDGKWRVKRGESEETIQTIENELRGTMQNARAPLPPKPPTEGVPPLPPGTMLTFSQFTAKITKLLTEKRLTKSELTGVLDSFNVRGLSLVANVPHLIPQISAAVDALFIKSAA